MDVERLPRIRPPCSRGERAAAGLLQRGLAGFGVPARPQSFRAPTSPTWGPLIRAFLRMLAAVLVWTDLPEAAAGAAAAAVLVSLPGLSRILERLPGLGGTSHNLVAHVRGAGGSDPPLVVAAHLDAHPTGGAPLHRWHRLATGISTLMVAGAAAGLWLADPANDAWRALTAVAGVEAVLTMGRLVWGELGAEASADDNGSGLIALLRVGELAAEEPPTRDLWLVATGGGMVGGRGIRTFLRTHPEVARVAWVVEVDALGAGELVCCPVRRRFPRASTPQAVVRAVVGAAIDTGDPIDVRRVRRPHSDARVAFKRRAPAVSLTAGVRPPMEAQEPDPANAERAARIVNGLARTSL